MPDAAVVRLYGSPGVPADEIAARIARARSIEPGDADRLVAVAGAHERPPVQTVPELRTARPAVSYYAFRLLGEHGQGRLW